MAACERCWDDAFHRAVVSGDRSRQAEIYREILDERRDEPIELDRCAAYNAIRAAELMASEAWLSDEGQ